MRDEKYNIDARRQYTVIGSSAAYGRSSIRIQCPFCDTVVRAYVWSLSGCGKKCDGCGALHVSHGSTWPLNETKSETSE